MMYAMNAANIIQSFNALMKLINASTAKKSIQHDIKNVFIKSTKFKVYILINAKRQFISMNKQNSYRLMQTIAIL